MQKLIECVPNFSEGRKPEIIKAITQAIETVETVKLLDVDPGKATNRTVVTFVGDPDSVVEAAFRGIAKAAELIDMSQHSGEHARMGATDVCPFIPVSGISMEETADYAQKLARRVGEELNIPTYLYEAAQPNKKRSNLSVIRSGEYEGYFDKIKLPEWQPDFGPSEFPAGSGATVIGARDFLIAYNVNLNTRSTRIANRIAFDVREAGRILREGNPISGKPVLDEQGEPVRVPGKLKHVKAVGWYIEEYNMAQISMNLTNYLETPLHVAFDETCKSAEERGARVTGSELVGLVPLKPMLDAGRYFLQKQGISTGVSEAELVHTAIRSLGLDELAPFDPNKKIIEYLLRDPKQEKLASLSVKDFANETASESLAPGGGSVSALVGAMGAALGAMVANGSANKRGWEERIEEFSPWAEKGQQIKDDLLFLIDEDTRAFDGIMNAYGLPKDNEEQKTARSAAIEAANQYATEVPFRTMKAAYACVEVLAAMKEKGNPNAASDVAVGALCVKTAVRGAWLNVLINAPGLKDKAFAERIVSEAEALLKKNHEACDAIVLGIEADLRK
ncbi:MAG: glutamate formimidoyltransferase [Bacteroidetes bacterium]|nr:glutamate formimidoyltransferase [Bacteroidota bacterium]MDA0943217.1 glutamate formimidoyltransferase [Bacteroidota bacterium]MDA1111194.1 glutamate formimidoyltransferase [Bacteroidota bacterium]